MKRLRIIGEIIREKIIFNLLKLIVSRSYIVKIKVDNNELLFSTHYEGIQVIDEIILLNAYKKSIDFLLNTKNQNILIIDLGAHIGVFSVFIAFKTLHARKKARIIAIEPVSINYHHLITNIHLNRYVKVIQPIKCAVSTNHGIIKLQWLNSTEKVRTVPMHEIIKNILKKHNKEYIDLLKIDIEGAEHDILTKNNDWLKYVKVIVGEYHIQSYGWQGLYNIIKSLKKRGFQVYVVETRVDTKFALVNWIKRVRGSTSSIIFTIWKIIISMFIKKYRIKYFIAYNIKII